MAIISTPKETGGGDFSWLGSAHAIWNGQSVTLDISKFTPGTDFPNGIIKSGTPVTIDSDGLAARYDGTNLGGFIFQDTAVNTGDTRVEAAMLDHGRIVTANVPFSGFTKPATQANTTFVFV